MSNFIRTPWLEWRKRFFIWPRWLPCPYKVKKPFKIVFSGTIKPNGFGTRYATLGMWALPSLHKWWFWVDLDLRLLLLIFCLLLLPLWESVIVLCIVVRYFMSILVLQSSWWGRESWLLCLICLPGVSWWLSGSSSRCHGVVCSLWLWYFLIILTYYFLWQGQRFLLYLYGEILKISFFCNCKSWNHKTCKKC